MARRRRSRPLGALLDNVQPWQIAVGVGVVGAGIWFFTRKKEQPVTTVNVQVPVAPAQQTPTDLVVTGSSAPPAQTGITAMSKNTGVRLNPAALKNLRAKMGSRFNRDAMRAAVASNQQAAADQQAAKQSASADPCAGLTGRDALDCRAAAAQTDLDTELAKGA